ncbi:MAG: DUF3341 domain-containing protein [Myxococcales bacterium]|nr:DUF3341 domain-containing protein [Myxococcales bacterium]
MTPSTSLKPAVVLAEFGTPAACLKAAASLRDAGYKHFDAHTPYPVHGMDQAMGLRQSPMGWLSLMGGLVGAISAYVMIWWMNGVDYPLVVGGKPPGSVLSMIPVIFEVTILLCGFATFFGLLHLMKLPRHHHPVFTSDRFAACSDDKFFLSVEASDPQFEVAKIQDLFRQLSPLSIEVIEEES